MVRDVSEPIGGSSRLEPLVTVDEAATFLGVQVGTVYLWAETERIPPFKIGALRSLRRSHSSADGIPIGRFMDTRVGGLACRLERVEGSPSRLHEFLAYYHGWTGVSIWTASARGTRG